jgi:hypothetical protein
MQMEFFLYSFIFVVVKLRFCFVSFSLFNQQPVLLLIFKRSSNAGLRRVLSPASSRIFHPAVMRVPQLFYSLILGLSLVPYISAA